MHFVRYLLSRFFNPVRCVFSAIICVNRRNLWISFFST